MMNQEILWKPSEREQLEFFLLEIKSHNHIIATKGQCAKCIKANSLCCKQLCIIQGHSGCGKKITLQLIAKQLSVELLEYDSVGNYRENLVDKTQIFLNFLNESRRKRRLNFNKNYVTKATVIYDIPSTIEINFLDLLKRELYSIMTTCSGLVCPFIILVNDSSRDNIFLNKIFEEYISNPSIAFIKIASINKRKIKIFLTDWLNEKYNSKCMLRSLTPLINYLSEIAKGDIRFALSMLQFYSISNFNNYLPLGKDGTLTPFHTLGKFLYNKRYPSVKWSQIQCHHETDKYTNFLSQNLVNPPKKPDATAERVNIGQYWDILELDISPSTPTPIGVNEEVNNSSLNAPNSDLSYDFSYKVTTLDVVNNGLCKLNWCNLPLGVKLDGLGKSKNFQYLDPYQIAQGQGDPRQLSHKELFPKANRPCSYFVPEEVIAMSGCDEEYFTESLRQEFINFYQSLTDVAKMESQFAFLDFIRGVVSKYNYSLLEKMNLSAVAARGVLDCNLSPIVPQSSSSWLYQFNSLEYVTNERRRRRLREVVRGEGLSNSEFTYKYILPFKYLMKSVVNQLSRVYDGWHV